MKKATKMVEEITLQRKLTDDIKQVLHKKMFKNICIAIGIIIYLCAINIVAIYAPIDTLNLVLKIIAIVSIVINVLLFEIAYRKDSISLGITGIELLIVNCLVLYMPHIYNNIDKLIARCCMLMPAFFAIYYIIKIIFIYIKTKKEYQNNLSDVKEIVKEEEEI